MINLGRGFRLLDFSLYGEAKRGKNPFADGFSLQLGSLGGDPFPTAQFAISKKKLYDFRATGGRATSTGTRTTTWSCRQRGAAGGNFQGA